MPSNPLDNTYQSSVCEPHAAYTQRLEARRAEAARLWRLDQTIGNLRLAVFVVGAGLFWFVLRPGALSFWWLLPVIGGFVGLVFAHDRIQRQARRADRGVAFYEKGLRRLEDRWVGQGEPGTDFLDSEHPYAADLDLFGQGSLFELLCTARTRGGEQTLADWLRVPASPEEIRARQQAIDELRPRLDLREDLALRGADVRASLDPDSLLRWEATPPLQHLPVLRLSASLLAFAAVVSLAGGGLFEFGLIPFGIVFAIEGLFALSLRSRVQQVVTGIGRVQRDLALLSELLICLEQERFVSPRLVGLRSALEAGGSPPSRQLARLGRLMALLESRRNQFFAPIAAVLMWTTHIALAIEAWRTVFGQAGARWLVAVGEFEALCALAGYAYEHPRDPFPEIVPNDRKSEEASPCFEAEGLGHPLIPDSHCVRNDVSLGKRARVLIVSGSNMSGKSTLLRTIGVNAVLAFVGAPVRAWRLHLSPVAIGATIRVQDSLHAGSSHFYAEIIRLRRLLDLSEGPMPLLFLLDEIFHGTNSHDRRVGAEAIVRSFVNRGAIGLVTTHDLALARMVDTLERRAVNVCFEDQLVDGQLEFDYRMRPGIVTKSNALDLMRAVGLEV